MPIVEYDEEKPIGHRVGERRKLVGKRASSTGTHHRRPRWQLAEEHHNADFDERDENLTFCRFRPRHGEVLGLAQGKPIVASST